MASEMSTMEQSGMDSTASTSGGQSDAPASGTSGLPLILLCCVLLGIAGVAGFILMGSGKGEGTETNKGGDEITEGRRIVPPTTTTTKATTTTTTTTTPRPVFCVVGERLVTTEIITSGSCNYVIYPDLIYVDDKFQGLRGKPSWDAFNEARRSSSAFIPGGAFLLSHTNDTTSTLSRIPQLRGKIADLVTSGFHALGFIDVPFFQGFKMKDLKNALEVFATSLSAIGNGSKTFLGVRVTTKAHIDSLAKEVLKIKGVNTIILQIHNAGTIEQKEPCRTQLMSYIGNEKITNMPTYKLAETAVSTIISKGFQGKVIMSSSAGVMIYAPQANKQITGFNQECRTAVLANHGALCYISKTNLKSDKATQTTSGVFKGSGGKSYWYTTDDQIAKWKGTSYLNASIGWAIFNVELDSRVPCQGKDAGELVKLLAKAASHPDLP